MSEASAEPAVGLDDGDRKWLAGLRARSGSQLTEIADRLCLNLAGGRDAKALGALRSTVADWLSAGLAAPDDHTLAAKRARVIDQFATLGLSPSATVAATGVLRRALDDLAASLFGVDEARHVASSVDKLLDRELVEMVGHQTRTYDVKLAMHERRSLAARVSAIQTLSTGFAHELRNPVNSARLQLELLGRQLHHAGDRAPKLVQTMSAIEEELDRLARLLSEFLAFARPGELVLVERDVLRLVAAVVSSEQAIATAHGVTLEHDDGDPIVACIDATKVEQIVQNLVRNAIEASRAGGNVIVITRAEHDDVHIDVKDDGPGIPEAVQLRIYEPFFTTKESGTGLGLSIVHSVVDLHGGTIEIQSSDRGSWFEIVLPRRMSR